MFVRLRKNKSGTTTVYLIDSIREHGKRYAVYKSVKCFGSSSDADQIELWASEARRLKQEMDGQKIDSRGIIKILRSEDVSSCLVDKIGMSYLYSSIFAQSFGSLRLKGVNKETLSKLVTMRTIHPVSKLKTARIADEFGIEELSANKIYKLMDSLGDEQISFLKKHVYNNTKKLLGGSNFINVLFYDLTTIYFEANSKSELKSFGFSKDGKSQHVQISLALIVTEGGLPIGYEIFKGNTFEGSTLIPTLNKLKVQYQVGDVTIVADSAMLSRSNMKSLSDNNFKYIVAARIKNMKQPITQEILSEAGYDNHSDDIKVKNINYEGNTLVSCFSLTRKRKDEYERQACLERIKKVVGQSPKSKLSGALKKSYVEIIGDGKIELNHNKLQAIEKFDGYFGYITNTDLPPAQVISLYKGLWQVEQSFRITKHNLKIRPVYHYTDRRIKTHFAICYLSLALVRTVEFKLKQAKLATPLEQFHELLSRVNQVKLTIGGNLCKIVTDIPENLTKIFIALGISLPKTYSVAKIIL